MNYKTYYRNKISINSAICTKFKLIFLVTIVLFFITTVSFAQENIQKFSFDCTKENSIHETILLNTNFVSFHTGPCFCLRKEDFANVYKNRFTFDTMGTERYRDFEAWWKTNAIPGTYIAGEGLPREGESKDYTLYCWTKEQLKAYYDEMKKFSGKPKD